MMETTLPIIISMKMVKVSKFIDSSYYITKNNTKRHQLTFNLIVLEVYLKAFLVEFVITFLLF